MSALIGKVARQPSSKAVIEPSLAAVAPSQAAIQPSLAAAERIEAVASWVVASWVAASWVTASQAAIVTAEVRELKLEQQLHFLP